MTLCRYRRLRFLQLLRFCRGRFGRGIERSEVLGHAATHLSSTLLHGQFCTLPGIALTSQLTWPKTLQNLGLGHCTWCNLQIAIFALRIRPKPKHTDLATWQQHNSAYFIWFQWNLWTLWWEKLDIKTLNCERRAPVDESSLWGGGACAERKA